MPKIDLEKQDIKIGTGYPSPYDEPCRTRRGIDLSAAAGLTQFGSRLVTLPPGSWSSQRHWHSHEDELVYIIAGHPTFVDDHGPQRLSPGDVTAHPGGDRNGHHMKNETEEDVVYLVVGTCAPARDHCHYPDVDMDLPVNGTENRIFVRKDGSLFQAD